MIPLLLRAAALAAPFLLIACGGASSESGTKGEPANEQLTVEPKKSVDSADMVIGSPDAKVTVIEYASLTCPHCATFHETIFPALKEKYVDTGRVKFIFREFPTPPAEFSYIGSVLARCAAEKNGSDAYFAVIGALFRTQRTWIFGDNPKAELLKVAGQVGMDEATFDACLKRQDLIDAINKRVEEGAEKYSITGTPSFVIDGEKVTAHTEEDFEKILDEKLAKVTG